MRALDPRLLRASRAARAHLALTVALGAAAAALIVAQAVLLARVVSAAFLDGASLASLQDEIFALLAVSAGRAVVAAGFEASGRLGADRAMANLRGRLVDHLVRRHPGGLRDRHTGDLVADAVQGVDALEALFARYLPQLVLGAVLPPAIVVYLLGLSWPAALALAVTLPLLVAFMVLLGRRAREHTERRWRVLGLLSGHFLDVVRGIDTLRAHNRAEAQGDTIAAVSERFRVETMRTLRVAFLSALVLELAAMLGVALVAATIGVQLTSGALALEAGLTVLILAPECYAPLRALGAQFHASADGTAAAQRIFDVLDRAAAVSAPAAPEPAPDPAAFPVCLEHAGFAYPGRPEPVLRDVDLRLAPGEVVALVGANGSGKSTLGGLLLRLADPVAGRGQLRRDRPARRRSRRLARAGVLGASAAAAVLGHGGRQRAPRRSRRSRALRARGARRRGGARPG